MYPYFLLQKNIEIYPILPDDFGNPYFFNYTDPIFAELPIRDISFMQAWNNQALAESGKKWWIAWYLEDRSHRLRWTHLIDEWRVYHLGIDIIAPAGTNIYSPLDGTVVESTIEPGKASYGWYVLIEYIVNWSSFFLLFGHLDPETLHPIGSIRSWESIGNIWSGEVNGGWTSHLHIQAFTWKDFDIWKMKWYCTLEDIPKMWWICPDPSFLIRY